MFLLAQPYVLLHGSVLATGQAHAPGRADDRVDVRARDQRRQVQEELRRRTSACSCTCAPEAGSLPGSAAARAGPPDGDRHAALAGRKR